VRWASAALPTASNKLFRGERVEGPEFSGPFVCQVSLSKL
jgi:hypothetical protein